MGKSKDKKKKGKGMEKTLAKTEKKLDKNLKKELQEIGEEDIETLIAAFKEDINQVKVDLLPVGEFPSRRGGATFSLLPEKEEIILFGGEYYDGKKVKMFNELLIYSIKKNQWSLVKAPNSPPPRTFHQACVVSRNGGELWVFGGEFSSPSQSQFYHYNDLWCFNFQSKQWTKIVAQNAPSPRSGHRMVVMKKYLVIFGGYYDNLRNCRFYNDTYLFNLETNHWEDIKFSSAGMNSAPSPRSACHFFPNNKNNTIIVYGGFSKEKLKKDKEKAVVHSDMFVLSHEVKKTGVTEWSWSRAKQSGMKPSERISSSMITISDDSAILFGGVYDNQDEDNEDEDAESNSTFFNDLYKLDLSSHKWSLLSLRGKKEIKKKAKAEARQNDENEDETEDDSDESDKQNESLNEKEEKLDINQLVIDKQRLEENSAFTLSYENKKQTEEDTVVSVKTDNTSTQNLLTPHPRRSSYIQFFKGNLYLYGGKFEGNDDLEITFNDMFCLNVKKLDEWKHIFEDKDIKLEELKKADDSESDEDKDEDSEEEDSDMEIDAPNIEDNETLDEYFNRNKEFWIDEVKSEFSNEASDKKLNKLAYEFCSMFYKNLTDSKKEASAASK